MENHLFVDQLMYTFHLQVVVHVAQYSWELSAWIATDCSPPVFVLINLLTSGKKIILCNVVDIEENENQESLILFQHVYAIWE